MTTLVPNTTSPEGWGMFAGRTYGGTRPATDGGPPLTGEDHDRALAAWLEARDAAVASARNLLDLGVLAPVPQISARWG